MRPRTIGEKLKKKRLDMGLFQKDIAEIIGLDVNTITNWEKGRTRPGERFIMDIERFIASA